MDTTVIAMAMSREWRRPPERLVPYMDSFPMGHVPEATRERNKDLVKKSPQGSGKVRQQLSRVGGGK